MASPHQPPLRLRGGTSNQLAELHAVVEKYASAEPPEVRRSIESLVGDAVMGTSPGTSSYSPAAQKRARRWVDENKHFLTMWKSRWDGVDPTNITVRRKKKAIAEKPKEGTGLKPKRRVVRGGGIERNSSARWVDFGRYCIHVPSLKTYVLCVKYPSLASIPDLPKVDLSEELRDFLLDLTSGGNPRNPPGSQSARIDQRLYAALSKEDKHLFDTLAHRAQVDEQLGLRLDKNLWEPKGVSGGYPPEDDLKQFEIVRGEIIAGNDAPELLEQLKKFVLKFLRDGTLSKTEAADLLGELSAV
jgi:hypothetical protein